jgi:dihydroxyacetone kinase-like protein
MSRATLRECILAAADAIDAARDELCRLDAVAGDGDHGVTMALAAQAVRKKLDENPGATAADLLAKVALGMGSVGGAIGPIYATGLLRVAGVVRTLGAGDESPTVDQLRACAEAAATGIAALGHAKAGDKTMLDALYPVVSALESAEREALPVQDALEAAAVAARSGAEATAGMIATLGRASRLGERSRGSADPGATSFAIIVDALVSAWLVGLRVRSTLSEG